MKKRIITKEQLSLFEQKLRKEEKSEATIGKYLRDARAFAAYAEKAGVTGGKRDKGGDGAVLTKELAVAYKENLIAGDYATRSVNSMIASLNSLFAFLGCQDCRLKTLKLQQEIFRPEEKELTKAEYERLCRAAERKHNEKLCLILQTICGTGIRVSELGFITTEAARHGEARVSCKGKNRVVFLPRALQKKLLRYTSEQNIKSGAIFITRNGKPMNRTTIWREMKNLCKEAHVSPTKVFPHNLRHLFARIFYGMEKDIAKLADILGHSSINTTRIYIVSTGAEHRKRMENMHLIL